jgi:hypothetical protein
MVKHVSLAYQHNAEQTFYGFVSPSSQENVKLVTLPLLVDEGSIRL